tara:strand:+ start:1744 stop:2109 length:366 start_codon:yes stop_codon:yes gene_type:complete
LSQDRSHQKEKEDMQKTQTKEVPLKNTIDKEDPNRPVNMATCSCGKEFNSCNCNNQSNMESILEELPQLLVTHAYTKLKSGEPLTASELKVCLDVCKAYSSETLIKPPANILETVPFDVDG